MLKKGILSLASLYRPYYTVAIVQNFAAARYSLAQYVRWYMHTNNFTEAVDISRRVSVTEKQLIIVTGASTVALTLVGLAFIVEGFTNTAAYTWFGAAIIFATPLVCAVLLPVYYVLMRIIFALYPKKLGKRFLCILLEAQVKRLRKNIHFR